MTRRITVAMAVVLSCAGFLHAEEPMTNGPLVAHVFYCPPGTNADSSVNIGDTMDIMLTIQNRSTNLVILSLDSTFVYGYRGQPGGNFFGGGGSIRSPFSTFFPSPAESYAFIKPRGTVRQNIAFKVPAELGDHPYTAMDFRATIYANKSGKDYGLNAWTGKLDVVGFTVSLRKSNQAEADPASHPSYREWLQQRWHTSRFREDGDQDDELNGLALPGRESLPVRTVEVEEIVDKGITPPPEQDTREKALIDDTKSTLGQTLINDTK